MIKFATAQWLTARSALVFLSCLTLAFAATGQSGTAPAKAVEFDAAQHFKGKTIRFVVDYRPGGGTDLQARYFAANWGKFIPGSPRIIVTNLFPHPAGRNYVWKAVPDGTTLSFLALLGIGDDMIDPSEPPTDKFTYIGSHEKRSPVLVTRDMVPYSTLKDAKGGKVVITIAGSIGAPADINGLEMGVGMLAMWFDVPLRFATVQTSGQATALIMLERGDVNSMIADAWYSLPTLRPGWFSKGYVKVIANLGHPDQPSLPNAEISMPLPNAMTWLNEEQKALWKGIVLPAVLSGKGVSGPPNMSRDIAKVLRDAYATALADPTFAKGLEKLSGQPAYLIRGEKLQELVVEASKSFKEQLPRNKEIRQQVYDRFVR